MYYKKSIKGDANTANEEFSHNRITIVAGGAGVILVCFVCCLVLAAILWMIARQGALFSILIILSFLALFTVGMTVIFALGLSFVVERLSFMVREVRLNRLLGTTVVAGEVVSHFNGDDWDHLSAIHEQAKLAQLPAPKNMNADDATTILELYDKGLSLRAIEKQVKDSGITYYQIQKVVSTQRPK